MRVHPSYRAVFSLTLGWSKPEAPSAALGMRLLCVPTRVPTISEFFFMYAVSLVSHYMQALRSLVSNPSVQVEPYLPQMIPFILTCMVGKRLGVSSMGFLGCYCVALFSGQSM